MTTSGIVYVYTSKAYIGKASSVVAKVPFQPNQNLNLDHGSSDKRLITVYEGHEFMATGLTVLKDGRCVLISSLADEIDNPMSFVPDEIAYLVTIRQAASIIDITQSSHLLELPKFKYVALYHEETTALLEDCPVDEEPTEMPMELVKFLQGKKAKKPSRKGPRTNHEKKLQVEMDEATIRAAARKSAKEYKKKELIRV